MYWAPLAPLWKCMQFSALHEYYIFLNTWHLILFEIDSKCMFPSSADLGSVPVLYVTVSDSFRMRLWNRKILLHVSLENETTLIFPLICLQKDINSHRKTKACMKRCVDKREAKDVCQDRDMCWKIAHKCNEDYQRGDRRLKWNTLDTHGNSWRGLHSGYGKETGSS